MRIAIMAGAFALALPFAAQARTVTLDFDSIGFDQRSYVENGFSVGFDGLGGIYGASRDSFLELQDGGTGSTPSAVISAVDGSEFRLLSAEVFGVQRSEVAYEAAAVNASLNGAETASTAFLPPASTETVQFGLGQADRIFLGFNLPSQKVLANCGSPCSSIFYDSVTIETAAVPIPASGVLLAFGLGAIGIGRRFAMTKTTER